MKYLFLFFIGLAPVFFQSCQDKDDSCPARTDLGLVELEAGSFDYIPYDTDDTLIYRNELGEEIRFFHAFDNLHTRFNYIVGDIPCSRTSEETSAVRLEGEMLERWFVTLNGLQIRYFLRIQPLLPPPNLTIERIGDWKDFYDVFTCQVFRRSLGVEELDESCAFSVIASYREGPPVAASNGWMNEHRFFSEVAVGGKTFQGAYGPEDCQIYPDFFYTKEQGVVSFRDTDGQLWFLDRVE